MALRLKHVFFALVLLTVVVAAGTLLFAAIGDVSATVNYVISFEDCAYLNWQAELAVYNFKKLGIANQLWLSVLFADAAGGPSPSARAIALRHPQTYFFHNTFPNYKAYKPVCKSFGIALLLDKYPHLGRRIFVLDTDVVLRRPIDFSELLGDDCIYGSRTDSYLSYGHFKEYAGVSESDLAQFTATVGLPVDVYRSASDTSIIGAQYLFKNVDAAFFHKIARDAIKLNAFAKSLADRGSKIQVWVCGDMGSFLFNSFLRVGPKRVRTHPALDFVWPTDPVDKFKTVNMCHMAGVPFPNSTMFSKQMYSDMPPWDPRAADFSYVTDKSTCAQMWLDAVREYAFREHKILLT